MMDIEFPGLDSVHRTRWHAERIGALAVYCSDGRWGEAFDEFCHRHLQLRDLVVTQCPRVLK
jgi:hypothetical protein